MNFFHKIERRVSKQLLSFQYNSLGREIVFAPGDALIISGDPRGGTTWLAELINHTPNTSMIWEPLAISEVKQYKNAGFQWRQFIPEHEVWPEAKRIFTDLFSGKLISPYLCQRTTPNELKAAKQLIIKFCRANQLLPWLTRSFQFTYAPIYLVRHPCAVVASQLKQGGWTHVKPSFELPKGRFDSFYKDHTDFLRTIDTVEKRLAATWCLCNQVPLMHSENNKRWITVTYESMLLDGFSQLKRIERRWGIEFPKLVYDK